MARAHARLNGHQMGHLLLAFNWTHAVKMAALTIVTQPPAGRGRFTPSDHTTSTIRLHNIHNRFTQSTLDSFPFGSHNIHHRITQHPPSDHTTSTIGSHNIHLEFSQISIQLEHTHTHTHISNLLQHSPPPHRTTPGTHRTSHIIRHCRPSSERKR
jgi:hypothetical protein